MNCEEARTLLEEYFDGELEARRAARVAAHVEACESCAADYELLTREQEFYLSAAPSAAPGADSWAGVSARLGGAKEGRAARLWRGLRRRRGGAFDALGAPRFSPALTAAAVLAAVALTAGVMKYTDSRRPTQPAPPGVARQGDAPDASPAEAERNAPPVVVPNAAARTEDGGTSRAPAALAEGDGDMIRAARAGGDGAVSKSVAPAAGERRRVVAAAAGAEAHAPARTRPADLRREVTSDELVRAAEGKYVAAIALLARDVRRRRDSLDREEAARFGRTLAAVDRAIAETRRAARSRPRDPVAAQYMLAAYSKKVDLLREMATH
jgi:Putative zinc-finger